MTSIVCVKVLEGMILAADSANLLSFATSQASEQLYYNADKIFHLHPLLPIAAMTAGNSVIAPMAPLPVVAPNVTSLSSAASVVSLSRRLSLQLSGQDQDDDEPPFNINEFTVENVAERASRLFAKACAKAQEDAQKNSWVFNVDLTYVVAGVSSGCNQTEAWLLTFQGATFQPTPVAILGREEYGFKALGRSAPVYRLFDGFDPALRATLIAYEVDRQRPAKEAELMIDTLLRTFPVHPVAPGMPLLDASGLARFMVETTKGFERYTPGPDYVGGPIDMASIDPYEGFRWISRKH